MFTYYLKLALNSIKRTPILSVLMITAIALGIGACMTTITVNYMMSANPIPHKSDQLFYVRLDNWDPNFGWGDNGDAPDRNGGRRRRHPARLGWRDGYFHHPRLPFQDCRWSDDQLPPSEIDADDVGLGLHRA